MLNEITLYAIICVAVGLIALHCGSKDSGSRKPQKDSRRKYYDELPIQTPHSSTTPQQPYKKFKDSRWEDKHDLFWGMIQEGISVKQRRSGFLLSEVENVYLKNLQTWFGKYCDVHSQVSLGQLIDMPEDDAFSDEERKRFFSIYNAMAIDYILVSKKTRRVVCAIELNDSSHDTLERQERDTKLVTLMKISGVPLLLIPTSHIGPVLR